VREIRTLGSVRGPARKGRSYRDTETGERWGGPSTRLARASRLRANGGAGALRRARGERGGLVDLGVSSGGGSEGDRVPVELGGAPAEAGEVLMVKVHCREGVATHSGPRVMRGAPRGAWRSVDRGACGLGIEPRNLRRTEGRRCPPMRKATPRVSAMRATPCLGLDLYPRPT
jgi:hypothetical protein